MKNLILALTSDGDYQKALVICDQLERECGDRHSANSYRATIYLNLGDCDNVISCARGDGDFVKYFALCENGNRLKALECFLIDAVESPHTAKLLLDMRKPKPESSSAVDDHNAGVHLKSQLQGYFKRQSTISAEIDCCTV